MWARALKNVRQLCSKTKNIKEYRVEGGAKLLACLGRPHVGGPALISNARKIWNLLIFYAEGRSVQTTQ
jgi:hypothetical protein